jgi:serine/threonine protein kinase
MIGKTLSHYRIVEKIGQSGMVEVYEAKDQKLGKNIPIKALPQEYARHAERVARFELETNCLLAVHARAF